MKKLRKISRKYYLRQIVACWMVYSMLFFIPVRVAMADINPLPDAVPGPGNLTGAVGAGITNTAPNLLEITQTNNEAIMNWNNFDIGQNSAVQFIQPNVDASVLNRVSDAAGTGIMGSLTANGRVFIINPAGIVLGAGATINVPTLVASSLDITDSDFLNGMPYQFTENTEFDGVVSNDGASFIDAEHIALIGRRVINRGTLVADNLVIMAAGDTVLLSESGSNVAVKATVPDGWYSGSGIYEVRNIDGGIDVEGETARVILAAGDVWSSALVKAYSDGGSDAVATVEISAAGNVTITDDVEAEAVAPTSADNAIAAVTINAGGDIKATGTAFEDTEIMATASDGLNNTATVDITAEGDVTQNDAVIIQAEADPEVVLSLLNQAEVSITGRNVTIETLSEGWIDAWYSADALIGAYAENANVNRATVNITATGDEECAGDVLLQAGGLKDCALVEAVAENGSENYADVVINATGDVSVIADSANTKITAKAWNELDEEDLSDGTIAGLTNTATVDITAGGDVEIIGQGHNNDAIVEAIAKNEIELAPEIEPEVVVEIIDDKEVEVAQDVELDLVIQGLTNTATINITANNGSVDIKAECDNSGAEAVVKATAGNEIKVDIENYADDVDYDTTVNLDVTNLENNAGVAITASGEECGDGDIIVGGEHGYGLVRAEAYNELEVVHKGCGWGWWYTPVQPATLLLTVNGLQNTATVDMTASDDVKVMADGGYGWWSWTPYTAGIEAEAYNDFEMDFDNETTASSLAFNDLTNTAGIGITAGEDVKVLAENGGEAGMIASSWNYLDADNDEGDDITGDNITNNAGVDIVAGGDVKVKADCLGDCSDAYIVAEAYNDGDVSIEDDIEELAPGNITNTASVDITAGGDVKVIGKDCGDAEIVADTWLGTDNTSTVTINTLHGDVLVLGKNGDASIEALAEEGVDNTATVGIDAVGGDVLVIDIGGDEVVNTAKIVASAEEAYNSNTANVTVNATAEVVTEEIEPDVTEECVVGGNVLVLAKDGGKAQIAAYAADSQGELTNTANVTIRATGAEATELVPVEPVPVFTALDVELLQPIEPEFEEVTYMEGGDVKVIAECGGEAEIEAIALDGYTNSSDVLICADGDLKVKGDRGGKAEIEAIAKDGYANTAGVGIGARGEDGVAVIADRGGEAGISSKAKNGETNTASTIVCTQGGVDVLAQRGGDAEILAQAKYGLFNDAYVGIGAMGDVLVQTGQIDLVGCDALIRAEAETGEICIQQEPGEEPVITTADAEVVVFTHEGSVEVLANNGGHSGVEAEAQGAHLNTAKVGVAAGADLSPADVYVVPEYPEISLMSVDDLEPWPVTGNVYVDAYGKGSEAQILAWAHDATPIYEYSDIPVPEAMERISEIELIEIPGENTAQTVICAPGEVSVYADDGSDAKIKSWAGGWREDESINTATTQVYATDVEVDVPDRRGNGITAWAVGSEKVTVPDNHYDVELDDGRLTYCLKDDGAVAITDGTSTLIVDDYSVRKDCPTCPPCPCEEAELLAPVAPLPVIEIPRIEGCPGLMMATALELGVPGETVQVAMGNALALNPSLQPCEACASLINAAKILRDEDGSRMAAVVQAFNTLAPANAPMAPEMEASIAMAFENAPEGSQYALAKEYIDAFVQYASALENQLGSPTGDSMAFVMGKYGAGITESANNNVAAYVVSRLQGI